MRAYKPPSLRGAATRPPYMHVRPVRDAGRGASTTTSAPAGVAVRRKPSCIR